MLALRVAALALAAAAYNSTQCAGSFDASDFEHDSNDSLTSWFVIFLETKIHGTKFDHANVQTHCAKKH